jgi:hypothetical protein
MLRSVFKPRQKVEGFTHIAAMIKLPCDGRQIPYPFSDVMGFCLKNISSVNVVGGTQTFNVDYLSKGVQLKIP